MRPVRFTKDEWVLVRDVLALSDGTAGFPVAKADKLRGTALDKLDAAANQAPHPISTGLSVKAALDAMQSVLGVGNVALSPHPDDAWFARMSVAIKQRRLTVDDFRSIARVLDGRGWNPPYSFERAVFGSDRLLAEYNSGRVGTRGGHKAAPVELDDL